MTTAVLNKESEQTAEGGCGNAGATIIVNKEGAGWRDKLGHLLRMWAQRLDGRLSLTVEFRTTHPVDQVRLKYCMDKGLECAARYATEFAQASARLGRQHQR